ncbi:MAG: rhomboid family intramembrane serine protease [Candidatus Competibacteraceae bacterium]
MLSRVIPFPFVSFALILTYTLIFLLQLTLPPATGWWLLYHFGFIPAVFFHHAVLDQPAPFPPVFTLLTAQFLHGGWPHLIGNMLYLWLFGDAVEQAMGHGRFLLFYLLCGSLAVLAQGLSDPTLAVPMIGASGAVAGILGAYLLLYPLALIAIRIPLGPFSRVIHLAAIGIIGVWLLLQVTGFAMADSSQSIIGWLAHLGGFLAGIVLLPVCKRRTVRLFNQGDPP